MSGRKPGFSESGISDRTVMEGSWVFQSLVYMSMVVPPQPKKLGAPSNLSPVRLTRKLGPPK